MTPLETQKQQVRGMIYNLREKLDDIMYGEENLTYAIELVDACVKMICQLKERNLL